MTEIDIMFTLTDAELDAVAGAQATASWTVSGTAAGPTSATLTGTATGDTSVVGGLAPEERASGSLSFESASA